LVGRRVAQNLSLTARLGLTTLGGSILAADSTVSAVFDTASQRVVEYQEGTEVRVSAPHLNVSLVAEWFPERYVYLMGGIQASVPLGSSVDVSRRILRPGNYVYGPGLGDRCTIDPASLESMSSLMFGLVGGIGVSYPVSFSMSAFAEATYTMMLSDVVNDAPWGLRVIGINLGARYRF
jgi:hypothetical protein